MDRTHGGSYLDIRLRAVLHEQLEMVHEDTDILRGQRSAVLDKGVERELHADRWRLFSMGQILPGWMWMLVHERVVTVSQSVLVWCPWGPLE